MVKWVKYQFRKALVVFKYKYGRANCGYRGHDGRRGSSVSVSACRKCVAAKSHQAYYQFKKAIDKTNYHNHLNGLEWAKRIANPNRYRHLPGPK